MTSIARPWHSLTALLLKTWSLTVIVMALFLHEAFYADDPVKEHVPKSQRSRASRLAAQWLLVLRSWLKAMFDPIQDWSLAIRRRRKQQQVLLYRSRAAERRGFERDRNKTSAQYKAWTRRCFPIFALTAVAMSTKVGEGAANASFDTDAHPIGIDCRASACISSARDDFVEGTLRKTNKSIKGFGGSRDSNVLVGTMQIHWEDDEGQVHQQDLPNSYYAPDGGVRLLSPQHFIKCSKDPVPRGTFFETHRDHVMMYWNGRKNRRRIPVDPVNNVFTFLSAPGYNRFEDFCLDCQIDDAEEDRAPLCMETNIVSDSGSDGEDNDSSGDSEDSDSEFFNFQLHKAGTEKPAAAVKSIKPQPLNSANFDLQGPDTGPVVVEDEEDRQGKEETATAELL